MLDCIFLILPKLFSQKYVLSSLTLHNLRYLNKCRIRYITGSSRNFFLQCIRKSALYSLLCHNVKKYRKGIWTEIEIIHVCDLSVMTRKAKQKRKLRRKCLANCRDITHTVKVYGEPVLRSRSQPLADPLRNTAENLNSIKLYNGNHPIRAMYVPTYRAEWPALALSGWQSGWGWSRPQWGHSRTPAPPLTGLKRAGMYSKSITWYDLTWNYSF